MLANGSTQIDDPAGLLGAAAGAPLGAPRTSLARPLSTFRHAATFVSPVQSRSAEHWIWLNGIGGITPSMLSWTSLRAWRAASASARTHSDFAPSLDHRTRTALAEFSR